MRAKKSREDVLDENYLPFIILDPDTNRCGDRLYYLNEESLSLE